MKTWCDHIKLLGDKYVIFNVNSIWEGIDFNFCPICGTPRPEPKKSLAEKLKQTWFTNTVQDDDYLYKALAKAALEHFSEIVDGWRKENFYSEHIGEEVKKKFKESL